MCIDISHKRCTENGRYTMDMVRYINPTITTEVCRALTSFSIMSEDYELFTPLAETRVIDDPRYSTEPDSGFLIVIPLYGAVRTGSTDPSDIVPGKRFCFLGKTYGNCYMEVDAVIGRLDANIRRSDYDALRANPNAQPFSVWDNKGNITPIPTYMLIDPSRFPDFNAWDVVQRGRWAIVCGVIYDARPSLPFNVYSRFIQPAANEINLFFTPSTPNPTDFTVAVLKNIFQVSNVVPCVTD